MDAGAGRYDEGSMGSDEGGETYSRNEIMLLTRVTVRDQDRGYGSQLVMRSMCKVEAFLNKRAATTYNKADQEANEKCVSSSNR